MELHHLGYACHNIGESLTQVKSLHDIKHISEIIFDEQQNAHLCLVELTNGSRIELVSGEPVKCFLERNINYYHICYEVTDLMAAIEKYINNGAVQISEIKPARLFDNRLVTFLQTDLGLVELLEKSPSSDTVDNKKVLIIASSFTTSVIDKAISHLLLESNLNYEIKHAPYNQIFQQLLDPSSAIRNNFHSFNIILIRLEDWTHYQTNISTDEFIRSIESNASELVIALKNAAEKSTCSYLLYICPTSPAMLNDQIRSQFLLSIEKYLSDEIAGINNVTCITSNEIKNKYKVDNYFDSHANQLAHIPYTPEFEAALGLIIARKIYSTHRPAIKVIVVDCDHTLWNGVCGEVGVHGVQFSPNNLELQKFLVGKHEAGLLICLCSKNNDNDVMAVFDNRQDMLLKVEHITERTINWNAKSKNIISLSQKLNIGLDSFIFIDDNPLECVEVQNNCPEVTVIEFPNDGVNITDLLNHLAFDYVITSTQAKSRNIWYKQAAQRRDDEKNFTNLSEFITSLNLVIDITAVTTNQIDRVAELTYRTNQFNTTSVRYNENEISHLISQGSTCLTVSANDRFGDYGLIGVVFYHHKNKILHIDNLAISCRALGRGIEHKIIETMGIIAQSMQLNLIEIAFIDTPKNAPALIFLNSSHFQKTKDFNHYSFTISADDATKIRYCPEDLYPYESAFNSKPSRTFKKTSKLISKYNQPHQLLDAIQLKDQNHENKLRADTGNIVDDCLTNILNELIPQTSISRFLNFFELGMDSLTSIQLIAKINKHLDVHLTIRDISNAPTLSALSSLIASKGKLQHTTICNNKSKEISQTSHNQQQLWFLDKLSESSWHYNMPIAFKISGKLNIIALKSAFISLSERHESLRTTFGNDNGKPFQIIHPSPFISFRIDELVYYDESTIKVLSDSEAKYVFDLENEPLFRIRLVKLKDECHLLFITKHHIIFDGWSYGIMNHELRQLYTAFIKNQPHILTPLTLQYSDFTQWQIMQVESGKIEIQLIYWEKKLKNIPTLHFPADYPRPKKQSYNGKYLPITLPSDLCDSLKSTSAKHNVTLFTVLLSALSVLIAKYSGQCDFPIGIPVSGRHAPHVEELIGFFVNTLVLRIDLNESLTFSQLLNQTQKLIIEAQENQDCPFDKVVERITTTRDISHNPLFQILFTYQNSATEKLELPGLEIEALYDGYDAARVDITLELINTEGKINGGIYYNSDLFKQETIAALVSCFQHLLRESCSSPIKNISTLSLIDQHEKENLYSKYAANNYIETKDSILDLFERQVKIHPDKIALQYQKSVVTYLELNTRSTNLAHQLTSISKCTNIIAIALDRSLNLVIAILACMKAGFTYIPLDPNHPEERLQYILDDTQAVTLVTTGKFSSKFKGFKNSVLNLDIEQCTHENGHKHESKFNPEKTAYIIYTSGTTGNPKGVMVSYQSLNNLLFSTENLYDFHHSDTIALYHSYTFDVSIWEMWTALCYGAKLLILPAETTRSSVELHRALSEEKITVLNITPSAFNQLIIYQSSQCQKTLPDLRYIILAGEALKPRELLPWFERNRNHTTKIINMYGITETTIYSTFAPINETIAKTNRSIIGQPIPGVQLYILDSGLNPVPANVIGEIYIGGHGLAKGYLNKPELTQEKFIEHPSPASQHKYIYKTGDLARHLSNDTIEYIGRSDTQIKLRGYRIELAEIENVLEKHEAVTSVLVRTTHLNDHHQLIAYVIPNMNIASPIRKFTEYSKSKSFINKELTTLPNGMLIAHLNKSETELLYKEIFINQEYYKNGICLKEGDTILDVGANIGMFSLFILRTLSKVNLYAFEPIPAIFDILEVNSMLYGHNITCLNYGLASESKTENFNYYPNMSVLSSKYANLVEETKLLKSAILERHKIQGNEVNTDEIDMLIKDRLASITIPCQLISLSDFIHDNNISQIDLLKIDVEKSELDVLAGINPEDWNKIKQIIVEVHDKDSALDKTISILKDANYNILVEKDKFYRGTNLVIVYASRIAHPSIQVNPVTQSPLVFKWSSPEILEKELLSFLDEKIPKYMVPDKVIFLDTFPVTQNGKLDTKSLPADGYMHASCGDSSSLHNRHTHTIREIWQNVLNIKIADTNTNFFDLGGNSLLIMQVHSQLLDSFTNMSITVTDLFNYPTIDKLSLFIENRYKNKSVDNINQQPKDDNQHIAVIGMAGKFPGANNVDEFWLNIRNGKETIRHFSDDELIDMGIDSELLMKSNYIKSCGMIEKLEQFDAEFFGYSPQEASFMDPQQRLFLETAWNALEVSGYTSSKYTGEIGIYAGMGDNDYLHKLYISKEHIANADLLIQLSNEKDYLTTKVAYKMGLTGSALNINTACSTSLVSVVKACQSLLLGENDIVLAGGISLIMPFKAGYLYERDGIFSSDGSCRAFDSLSTGTVPSSGVGVVVLKRLNDALRDGDNITAVITGYAVNNDGNDKVSYTAPSVTGQTKCILKAQSMAQVNPETISYLEAHGSGTSLGDPIEIQALTAAFDHTINKQFCAIGSVKTNIGHTQTAAGIAGLIKTILMLKYREIPPSLHYDQSNPNIDFAKTPFFVNTKLTRWDTGQETLVAGVNSFGLGGTNAHVILQSAPMCKIINISHRNFKILILSAKTSSALNNQAENLKQYLQNLKTHGSTHNISLGDVAFTLQSGRTDFRVRRAWICLDIDDAIRKLDINDVDIIYDKLEAGYQYTKLVNYAKRWINYQSVNWDELNNSSSRRIPLPTYPFATKRFWQDQSSTDGNAIVYLKGVNDLNYITDKISNIFKKILGLTTVELDASFFDLGGDSMSGLSLILQIERELGTKISLSDLLITNNIRSIAKIASERISSQSHGSRIVQLKSGDKTQPIFIFHPGNGALFHYYSLAEYLKTEKSIFGIENLLNDDTSDFASINEMAAHYINLLKTIQTNGPYLLCGWSFGGVIAFEIARQLEQQGERVSNIFLYDSWAKYSTQFKNEKYFKEFHSYSLNESVTDKSRWLSSLWRRAELLINYDPQIIRADIALFKAAILTEEYSDIDDAHNHWGNFSSGNVRVFPITGDHTTIIRNEGAQEIATIQLDLMNANEAVG